MLNNNLLILGAGGHGRVVKETAEAIGGFEQIDFLDDQLDLAIGKCEDFQEYINDYSYGFVAIGNNEQRIRWIEKLIEAGFNLPGTWFIPLLMLVHQQNLRLVV